MRKYNYESYEDYLKHQLRSRKNINKKSKAFKYRKNRILSFKKHFQELDLPKTTRCLCIGARFGEEVKGASKVFKKCLGIDLVGYPPLVQAGDVHSMKFDDSSFDLIYTNIIDHIYDPLLAFNEIKRVLKDEGLFLLHTFFQNKKPQMVISAKKKDLKCKGPLRSSSFMVKDIDELILFTDMTVISHKSVRDKFLFGVTESILFKKDQHDKA